MSDVIQTEDEVFDEVFAEEKKEVVEEEVVEEIVSDVPNEQQEQVEEPEQIEQRIADPLDSLSDEQKAAVEQLRQERIAWEHKYKSDQGRILAAQRLLHEKKQEEPKKSPTKEEIVEALADSEKFKIFKEDYGDVAEIVMLAKDEARRAAKQEILAEINPTLEEIKRSQAAREHEAQVAAIQGEFKRLEAAHPDWDQIAISPDFQEWTVRQPATVQQTIARSTSADEISAVMNYYKAERRMADIEKSGAYAQNKTNERNKALERSRGITPKTSAPSMEGTLPKNDFDAVFTAITK